MATFYAAGRITPAASWQDRSRNAAVVTTPRAATFERHYSAEATSARHVFSVRGYSAGAIVGAPPTESGETATPRPTAGLIWPRTTR